jgi:hypothetical protein
MTTVRFLTRPARENDHDFVHASFLESYRESEETNGIPNRVFFDVFKREFVTIVQRFTVLVAHPEDQQDEIAGWIAFSGRVLGWIYVKKNPWRNCGAGRLLWNAAGLGLQAAAVYSHHRAMRLARLKGLSITLLPHGKVVRMLEGA